MKPTKIIIIIIISIIVIYFIFTSPLIPGSQTATISERYIVVLKEDVSEAQRSSVSQTVDLVMDVKLNNVFNGFITNATQQQITLLNSDARVLFTQKDFKVEIQAQLVPTGVMRMESPHPGTGYVSNSRIIIMDTGLAPNHPDLNVIGGKNFRGDGPRDMWRDVNGHGTQVAGIAAACDNNIGVVGVAPCAELTAYRVLGDDGIGFAVEIIVAIDDIVANASLYDVVNMSFGIDSGRIRDTNCGLDNFDAYHMAMCRLRDSGVVIVGAAGNDRRAGDFFIPAGYTDAIIAVSALSDGDGLPGGLQNPLCRRNDPDDVIAPYSNWGFIVDLIAPGSCIRTTHHGGGYITVSGTSMAAPHVTGAVADYIAQNGKTDWLIIKADLQANGFPYNSTKGWTGDPDEFHEPLLSADVTASVIIPPRAMQDLFLDYIQGTIIIMDILANDIEGSFPIDPSSVVIFPSSSSQEVSINPNGTLTYTNSNIQNTTFRDFLWYIVDDTTGLVSNSAPVKIDVNPAPQPPDPPIPPPSDNLTELIQRVDDLELRVTALEEFTNWVDALFSSLFDLLGVRYA